MNCADLLCCQYKIFYLLINVGRWSFTQTDKRAGWRKMLLLGLTWLLIMGKNRILIGNGFIKWKLINKLHCISTGLCWFIVLSLTSGKKITNEKVFKYQSAGDKTIEIVESAKLPQLAHHLRPIFGLVLFPTTIPIKSESVHSEYGPSIDWELQCSLSYYSRNSQMFFCRCTIIIIAFTIVLLRLFSISKIIWFCMYQLLQDYTSELQKAN